MKKALSYGAALIALYLLTENTNGSGLLSSGFAGAEGLVASFQGRNAGKK